VSNEDERRINEANARRMSAQHAMQSGVLMAMSLDGVWNEGADGRFAKHLRVGVNTAMVESAALAKLLMDKGLFTRVEYAEALAEAHEAEAARHEADLSERYGAKIKLG
jgi:hypothetical protein